mgnify:CR=1 FL=1
MKKLRIAGILLLAVFLTAGCGNRDGGSTQGQNEEDNTATVTEDAESLDNDQEETQTQEEENTQDDPEQTDENDTGEAGGENAETQSEEQREVSIYYIDDATAEPTSETVMITDENDIWAALQEKGILTDDCELLGFELNEEEKTISINFNSALGDRIRSFGTTGETEIIGCLVNTYLDAYDCDGVKLLEEGKTFETSSGANFDGYTGRIEF